jgi:hypothetical protein
MKATATPLQQAYYDLLDGNVTIDGSAVSIYDQVPQSETYPYIQIDTQTAVDYSDKTAQGQEKTQTLWLVDRFSDSFGSRANINDMEDQVSQIICARPVPFDITGFNVITSLLDLSSFTRDRTETYTYLRIEMRFRHLIEEL